MRAPDGRHLTTAIVDEGGIFGAIVRLDAANYDGYAEALDDCALRVIPVSDFQRALTTHPQLAINVLRAASNRLRDAEDAAENLALRGGPARLATLLLQLTERYGKVTPTGIRIDKRFTHRQLAEMIGTTRETISKTVQDLRHSGTIDIREHRIWTLDTDALEHLQQSTRSS